MKASAILVIIFLSLAASADTGSTYQKGTLTKQTGPVSLYELDGTNATVWVKPCGDFQTGQAIEFRVAGDKAYIRRDNGGEYKCNITLRAVPTSEINAPPTYEKGTILGYTIRHDSDVSGGVSTWTRDDREAKVYELRGPDLVYQVDYCGAFQAGKFSPGQLVEFRVDENEERLYILHDMKKEYSCQLEGTRLARNPAPHASSASQANPGTSENASK